MEVNFPELEEKILQSWEKTRAFERSMKRRKNAPRFVFYEGPPTANAAPGLHHVLTRVFKDVVCRYKTMRGFSVPRRAGWDTHGLPVELQIEKKLGLKSKRDIEQYGIAKFNRECKSSVWEFKKDWEKLTSRIGFWIDMKNPYITYDPSYMQSLWYIIKVLWEKKLLYKDYKVVPYCARCGTPLSSHELAQGYKTVKDPAVYVKFKVKDDSLPNTYFLAWTTTPWTLPGNVGLAVAADAPYVLLKKDGEQYILSQARAGEVLGSYETIKTFTGKDLVGKKYEPLFRFKEGQRGKKIWEVVSAPFVTLEDGTGIAHTAVAYGVEDFELGKKENLAMLHLVDENGKFSKDAGPWQGMFVKDADPLITEDLKKRNLLLKEEVVEHEYPFCWRCSTPLLYYATESWFIDMQKVKQALLKNNKAVNWVPSHIQKGRMGEWLKEVKDWAFSRSRYWGTPLPLWECLQCRHQEALGSIEELREKTKSSNSYFMLRHGHSERQINDVMSCWPEKKPFKLTPKGVAQIQKVAKNLKQEKIDLIFSSDLLRTKQTAEVAAKELGIHVVFDERLREQDVGELNGKKVEMIAKLWAAQGETELEHYLRRFKEPFPGGESWQDMQKRMVGFLEDVDKRYQNKKILIVSHEAPFSMLEGTVRGYSREGIISFRKKNKMEAGELRELSFSKLPYNERMELDLHRPFIDAVEFPCAQCTKGSMRRVPDVVDVWFDSGAMPFAQSNWMGGDTPELFPADYIVEAIDQTRGWFYTLLAVSTLMGFQSPYKNVLVLGLLLDEKGEKMSKSKGNIVNPWDMIRKYGVDTIRWYFYTINRPSDPKLFSEKDLGNIMRKFTLTLWNCLAFYETYGVKTKIQTPKVAHVLDRWILSRLHSTSHAMSRDMDAFDITGAARQLEDFIVQDVSLWYVRRSRQRFQNPSSQKELVAASQTLSFVLRSAALLLAPFMPFLAEHVYEKTGGKGSAHGNHESVHAQDWITPQKKFMNAKLEQEMVFLRSIAAQALAQRSKAGMRVRQPLSRLTITKVLSKPLLEILKDEINVKEVIVKPSQKHEVLLDTALTPALKQEGMLRDLMRIIQDMRKKAQFRPSQKVSLRYEGDRELENILETSATLLMKQLNLKQVVKGKTKNFKQESQAVLEGKNLWLALLQ